MQFIQKTRNYIFPFILFLPVIFLSALGIHGYSIGVYNHYFYGADYHDPDLLFGQIRYIRSDEYLVSSPWALAQAENGLEEPNTIYLAAQDLTISDAPTDNWSGIFEPQNWGFLVLPMEQAFAFRWWMKTFMLTTAAYILFMMISKNDLTVSIMAALSLNFAPFFQWWYSTSVTDIASYGFFTFIFFIKLLNDQKFAAKIFDSLFLCYFAICFCLTLYPPFQVPLAVLLIVAGLGYILTKAPNTNPQELRNMLLNIGGIATIIGVVLIAYYLTHRIALTALANTTYPGIRESKGGTLMPLKVISGFYNILLQNDGRPVPTDFYNQSEAASFFFLSFFLLPFLIYSIVSSISRKQRPDLPLIFTLLLLGVLLVWGIKELPGWIASLLLLKFIDPLRMLFMLGLVNHLILVYFLYRVEVQVTLPYKLVVILYSLGVFAAVFCMGLYLRNIAPAYINRTFEILLISGTAGVIMSLLLFKKPQLFFVAFLAVTFLSTYRVNPLYRGIAPLRGTKLSIAIQDIRQKDPGAAWVGYGNLLVGNYLAANGAHVLNGTYYYPNLRFWRKFDPDQRYDSLYNRYSHVLVMPSEDDSKIKFELVQGDVVQINISPCHPLLQELGIKYFLFAMSPPTATCLSQIKVIDFPKMPMYIYERIEQAK